MKYHVKAFSANRVHDSLSFQTLVFVLGSKNLEKKTNITESWMLQRENVTESVGFKILR